MWNQRRKLAEEFKRKLEECFRNWGGYLAKKHSAEVQDAHIIWTKLAADWSVWKVLADNSQASESGSQGTAREGRSRPWEIGLACL